MEQELGSPNLDPGWVYHTTDGNVGPISTEQFLIAIGNGTVGRQTLVRMANSSQWTTAAEIDGIPFPPEDSTRSKEVSPEAEPPSPHPMTNVEMRRLFLECLEKQKAHRPPPKPVKAHSSGKSIGEFIGGAYNLVVSTLWDYLSLVLESLFSFLSWASRSKIVWSTLILLLISLSIPLIAPRVSESLLTEEEVHRCFTQVYADLKESRAGKGDAKGWDELQARSQRALDTSVPKLSRSAHGSNPISMSLLWLGRDYLPRYLAEKDGNSRELETKIEYHLCRIQANFDQIARSRARNQDAKWDITTIVIVAMDIIGVCIATIYFLPQLTVVIARMRER